MTRNRLIIAALLSLGPMAVAAAPEAGDREFTLSGTGNSADDLDANTFGASGSLGWFFTDSQEFGIRQSVNVADFENADSVWNGSTRAFYDLHLDLSAVQPFVGANLGYIYGDVINESFIGGPEAGLKFFVKDKTFIALQAEYQVFFEDADEAEEQFDNGSLVYSLGIGFNF
jgi:hypothetical protein